MQSSGFADFRMEQSVVPAKQKGRILVVKHIVMWKLKPGKSVREALPQIRTALEGLVGVVKGLRSVQVHACCAGWDLLLETEFEDRAALADYQVHPAHLEAKKVVHSFIEERTASDYEC